eukprot:TRINITY_DN1925_c11_g1_i1.p1 TRINITY_DN1925_c11_g1~~TRINITY_DN1925_c11_g1_i1.p1  ORF type:complete len:902 (+),score=342.68 TRINITY_DN1925_c11_g1_i1:61-2706(+)
MPVPSTARRDPRMPPQRSPSANAVMRSVSSSAPVTQRRWRSASANPPLRNRIEARSPGPPPPPPPADAPRRMLSMRSRYTAFDSKRCALLSGKVGGPAGAQAVRWFMFRVEANPRSGHCVGAMTPRTMQSRDGDTRPLSRIPGVVLSHAHLKEPGSKSLVRVDPSQKTVQWYQVQNEEHTALRPPVKVPDADWPLCPALQCFGQDVAAEIYDVTAQETEKEGAAKLRRALKLMHPSPLQRAQGRSKTPPAGVLPADALMTPPGLGRRRAADAGDGPAPPPQVEAGDVGRKGQDQMGELGRKLQDLESEQRQLFARSEAAELRRQLRAAEAEAEAQRANVQQVQTQLSDAVQRADAGDAELAEARAELAASRAELAEVRTELAVAVGDREALSADAVRLQAEAAQLRAKAEEAEAMLEAELTRRRDELAGRVTEARQDATRADAAEAEAGRLLAEAETSARRAAAAEALLDEERERQVLARRHAKALEIELAATLPRAEEAERLLERETASRAELQQSVAELEARLAGAGEGGVAGRLAAMADAAADLASAASRADAAESQLRAERKRREFEEERRTSVLKELGKKEAQLREALDRAAILQQSLALEREQRFALLSFRGNMSARSADSRLTHSAPTAPTSTSRASSQSPGFQTSVPSRAPSQSPSVSAQSSSAAPSRGPSRSPGPCRSASASGSKSTVGCGTQTSTTSSEAPTVSTGTFMEMMGGTRNTTAQGSGKITLRRIEEAARSIQDVESRGTTVPTDGESWELGELTTARGSRCFSPVAGILQLGRISRRTDGSGDPLVTARSPSGRRGGSVELALEDVCRELRELRARAETAEKALASTAKERDELRSKVDQAPPPRRAQSLPHGVPAELVSQVAE